MAPVARPAEIEAQAVPDFVLHWVKELNVVRQPIVKLKGGNNNRVYRCGSETNLYVIKGYEECPPGTRNRMKAEVEFLRFAGEAAQEFVPQLIEVDWTRRCVLLEYLSGKTYQYGYVPTEGDLDVVCEFARRINSYRQEAEQLITMNAAEGYIRLTEHLENVSDRIKNMSVEHLPECHKKKAEQLLENIQIRLNKTENQTTTKIERGELSDAINKDSLCISPSDFGFHNAIGNEGSIKFIDFEFAGWDDPAKLVSDFVLQPRIPVRPVPPGLLQNLCPSLTKATLERCALLGPILRIKWLCIILAVLNPNRLERLMAIHTETDVGALIEQRLKLSTNYLNERTPFGLH